MIDYARRHIAELDKQRAQQEEQHVEQQRRLQTQVSPHAPPLHMQVRALPPLSQSNGPQFALPLPHLDILVNALPQVPVVDFVQQHMIAQIPVTRQENEVTRLEQTVRDSALDPDEIIRFSQLLKIAVQEHGHLRAELQKEFGAPAAGANGAAGGATLLNNPADQLTGRMLLTDPSGQNVNGPNGVVGLFLNPSVTTFQPIFGDPLGVAANAGPASFECPPGSGPMSAQQYEVTLDLNYVADQQWEREEMQQKQEEMQQKIDRLEAERIRGQQVLHGSMQTIQLNEQPLQNSTAIGGSNDDARWPGLAVQKQLAVYVPPTELADKRQAAACDNSTLLNPYMQLGMRERTNMPPSEMQEIDVTMAMAMHNVHIHQFIVSTQKWNRWCYDFEVAMKGADIPQARWVAVLPSHLDDLS